MPYDYVELGKIIELPKIIKSRRKWKRGYSSLLLLTKSQDAGAGVLATEKVKSFDQGS
ncbi:6416_t:CDS:2 [Entrophospora sp. SA101]|nr:16241_t:CDS:2 [Entrophospora sp. SA101]CAJ0763639.1 6416_t:CDS:2 [Entrophospora sp. SA101]